MAVAGANVHDTKLLRPTLESIVVGRPEGAQNLCLDKGYDNPTGHGAVAEAGYQPHIRRIGEEKLDQTGEKIHPARRWVVERTLVLQSHILKVAAATVAEVENLALVTRQTYCLYCLLEVLIKAEKIELRL